MHSLILPSRRQFLQGSTAVAAASVLGLPQWAKAADTDLIVRTPEPFNAEPRLSALVADRITPVKHFYVRNHGQTPKVDAASYKLRIERMDGQELQLSLAEIKQRFQPVTVEVTLTCAGNRRQ